MNLGENIFKLRSEKGMSQGDLSNVLEVSRQSVSKWENNSAVPELDKLLKLSDLFGVTLDELVKGRKEPEPAPEIQPQVTTTVVQQMLPMPSSRVLVGMGMLIFGVIFFLLSICQFLLRCSIVCRIPSSNAVEGTKPVSSASSEISACRCITCSGP